MTKKNKGLVDTGEDGFILNESGVSVKTDGYDDLSESDQQEDPATPLTESGKTNMEKMQESVTSKEKADQSAGEK